MFGLLLGAALVVLAGCAEEPERDPGDAQLARDPAGCDMKRRNQSSTSAHCTASLAGAVLLCALAGCIADDPSGPPADASQQDVTVESDGDASETASDTAADTADVAADQDDPTDADALDDSADAPDVETSDTDASEWACGPDSQFSHQPEYDADCEGNVGCNNLGSPTDCTCACYTCDNERCIASICDESCRP